jgi:hypothetical protein
MNSTHLQEMEMIEALWKRYSASRSMPTAERLDRLAETVLPEVT